MVQEYLRLLKFRYHLSFVIVVAGVLLYTRPLRGARFLDLLLLYLCFNVLFYGGLYTINDILDRGDDAQHPAKRLRPVPSGRVPISSAVAFALTMILAGTATSFALFGEPILKYYGAFLVANLFYSALGRNIPYLELLLNGCTYPLRFLLGLSFTNHRVPISLVGSIFLFAVGVAATRRIVEGEAIGQQGRTTLGFYSLLGLTVLQIALLAGVVFLVLEDGDQPVVFHYVLVGLYLIMVFGYPWKPLRSAYHWLWLR